MTPSLMRVYLIRHGHTEWNNEGRAQGHKDVEIDKIGRGQARITAEFFDRRVVHRIISSDLTRCRQTAQPTADLTELGLELTPALRERSFGKLEGMHYTVLRAFFDGEVRDKGIKRWDARPDGGESLQDTWNRSLPVIEQVKATSEDTVIFSHGGTIALILAQFMNATIETAMSFKFDNCSITELKRLPTGIWQLVRYNDTRHLEVLHEEAPVD